MIRGRNMNFRNRILVALWITLLSGSVCFAQGVGVERDQKALDVLNSMSEYTASLDRLVLRGTAFTDGRLQDGLIVSNASEDLPDPESPVMTISLSLGRSISTLARLCVRAPRISMDFINRGEFADQPANIRRPATPAQKQQR